MTVHCAPTYIYRWNRLGRKGQRCTVTARGSLNSCRVVFGDGLVMITSRSALMRADPGQKTRPETRDKKVRFCSGFAINDKMLIYMD